MEVWRHIGAGRLSELFGSTTLKEDEFIRTLGWRQAAQRDLDAASPELKADLQAYADGVNDWISANKGQLGLAFVVEGLKAGLGGGVGGYVPEPWTPLDSATWALVQAWSLGDNFDSEIFRVLADAQAGRPGPDRRADSALPVKRTGHRAQRRAGLGRRRGEPAQRRGRRPARPSSRTGRPDR